MAALIIAAFSAGGGNSPSDNAPVSQVVTFYSAHATGQKVSAVLGTLGMVFFVFFAVALAGRVRAAGSPGWLANSVVAGAVAAAIGFLSVMTFQFVLANDIKFLSPGAAQAINVLGNDFFLPVVAGFVIFGIVAGLAVVISKTPARWMGWLLFGLGVVCAVPPLSWFLLLAMLLWSLVAGIWLGLQRPAPVPASEPDVTLTTV